MPYFKLFGPDGRRNFLTIEERKRFEKATKHFSREVKTLCLTLLYTGCRSSEATNLTFADFCYKEKQVRIQCLMLKNRSNVFRQVPISDSLLEELNLVHRLKAPSRNKDEKIWKWTSRTTLNYIHAVMKKAGIFGPHATARALRHSFGIYCTQKQIPLPIIQKWMGHATIDPALSYWEVMGLTERGLASMLWDG